MNDYRIDSVVKLAMLNPGKVTIIAYDLEKNKYVRFMDCSIAYNATVRNRLNYMFGEENVIFVE